MVTFSKKSKKKLALLFLVWYNVVVNYANTICLYILGGKHNV